MKCMVIGMHVDGAKKTNPFTQETVGRYTREWFLKKLFGGGGGDNHFADRPRWHAKDCLPCSTPIDALFPVKSSLDRHPPHCLLDPSFDLSDIYHFIPLLCPSLW